MRSSFNYPPGAILWSPKICLYFFSSAAGLLICGGAITLMTGSHAFGIDFRAPEIVLIESFRQHVSTLPTWELRFHTGHAYSATLKHRASALVLTTPWEAPHVVPDILRSILFRFFNFCTTLSMCFLYVS